MYFIKELKCSFITRICAGKKSRNIIIKDEDKNEITVSIQSLARTLKNKAKSKRKWINKKTKKELISKISCYFSKNRCYSNSQQLKLFDFRKKW